MVRCHLQLLTAQALFRKVESFELAANEVNHRLPLSRRESLQGFYVLHELTLRNSSVMVSVDFGKGGIVYFLRRRVVLVPAQLIDDDELLVGQAGLVFEIEIHLVCEGTGVISLVLVEARQEEESADGRVGGCWLAELKCGEEGFER